MLINFFKVRASVAIIARKWGQNEIAPFVNITLETEPGPDTPQRVEFSHRIEQRECKKKGGVFLNVDEWRFVVGHGEPRTLISLEKSVSPGQGDGKHPAKP